MPQGKTITLSNILSISRVFLLGPIFLSLMHNTPQGNGWALCFMALAVLTDFLDGFLARRLGQISDLGKFLDPVADKICLISVGWFLTLGQRLNPFPLWFFITVLARDVVVVALGVVVYRRLGLITASNIWGKTTSTLLAVLLIVYTLQIQHNPPFLGWLPSRLDHTLLWLSFSFMLVSTYTYALRFLRLLGQPRHVAYKSGMFAGGSSTQTPPNHSSP